MSRVQINKHSAIWFVMKCDQEGCDTRSELRSGMGNLRLKEFHDGGWFIAQYYGDACPMCVRSGTYVRTAPMPVEVMSYPSLETHQRNYISTLPEHLIQPGQHHTVSALRAERTLAEDVSTIRAVRALADAETSS